MTLSTQRWRPDTCGCVILQEFDKDDLPAGAHLKAFESKCQAHATLTDVEAYDAIHGTIAKPGENLRKNLAYKELLEIPELVEEKVNDAGDVVKTLKQSVVYDWSFTGTGKERVLNVDVKGAPKNVVDSLKTGNVAALGTITTK